MFFIEMGAGYSQDQRGIFLKWAGYRRDIGWISQLLETQLAISFNSTFIEIYNDMFWISYGFQACQTYKFIPLFDTSYFKTVVKVHSFEKGLCLLYILFVNFSQIQFELMVIGDDPHQIIAEFNFF